MSFYCESIFIGLFCFFDNNSHGRIRVTPKSSIFWDRKMFAYFRYDSLIAYTFLLMRQNILFLKVWQRFFFSFLSQSSSYFFSFTNSDFKSSRFCSPLLYEDDICSSSTFFVFHWRTSYHLLVCYAQYFCLSLSFLANVFMIFFSCFERTFSFSFSLPHKISKSIETIIFGLLNDRLALCETYDLCKFGEKVGCYGGNFEEPNYSFLGEFGKIQWLKFYLKMIL